MKKSLSLLLAFALFCTCILVNIQPAYADENDITAPITDPAEQAKALGFDTTQGQRTDEAGNPVDTAKHPLGVDISYFNRISQIGIISNTSFKIGSGVSNLPLTNDGMKANQDLMNLNGVLDNESLNAPKVSVAADFSGIGAFGQTDQGSIQVFVTAAIPKNKANNKNIDLKLFVSDYNGGKPVHSSFLIATIKKPERYDDRTTSNREYPIDMAAGDFDHDGKDELAIAVSSSLFIININKEMNPNTGSVSYALEKNSDVASADLGKDKIIRNDTLIPYIAEGIDTSNPLQIKPNGARNVIDIAAGDADSDGYADLLICSGDTVTQIQEGKKRIPDLNPAVLYIYSGTTDLNSPTTKIDLHPQSSNKKDPDKYIFTSASVSVGDAFNTGENAIIIGGRLNDQSLAITYLIYDGKGFGDISSASYPVYPISDNAAKGLKSWLPGIACAALDGPGMQEYVVFGNILLKYDGASFIKHDVAHPKAANKYKNTSLRYQHKSGHWFKDITDIYGGGKGEDSTYIISTIVGNFDGNLSGREQVLMLHYNRFYDGEHVFVTWCGREDNNSTDITTHLTKIWGGDQGKTNYPSIAAVDVLNTGITVVARPELTTFTFSDPSVIAVLGAAPYYKELNEQSREYSGVIGNIGTTYGTGAEKSSSLGGGISASAGVTFGFEDGLSILGKKIFSQEFEVEVKSSFTQSWTSTTSVSTSQSFTNLTADDQVVAMVIPYDVFYYEMYAKDSEKPELMEIRLPYAPIMQSMSLNYYNRVTQNMPSAPKVSPEVLNNHVVGDPRTYTLKNGQKPNEISNVMGMRLGQAFRKNTLYRGGAYEKSFIGTGIGEGITSQEITVSEEDEKAFDFSLETNVMVKTNILGVTKGVSGGVGASVTTSSAKSKSITSSGTVANVPEDYSYYAYRWCLAVYNYNLTTNDGKNISECHVVNYLTQPIGSFPPAQPQNLALKDKSLTLNSAVITWDAVKDAAAYNIYKSHSWDGRYEKVGTAPGTAMGSANTSYSITGLESGTQTYFKVSAVSTTLREGIASKSVPIIPIEVKSISMPSQPKLNYTEGEKLDLSGLAVALKYSDGQIDTVGYIDFSKNNLAADSSDQKVLNTYDTGKKITVTYKDANKTLSTQTQEISVSSKGSGDITANIVFSYSQYKEEDLLPKQVVQNGATEVIAPKIPWDTLSRAAGVTPGVPLYAYAGIRNNTSMTQDVLVILVLYDQNGSMVSMNSLGRRIGAGATEVYSLSVITPFDVNQYRAKVLVWDGNDINATKQTPKAYPVQLP
ncbi:fibronectin type III domain-containing protein [Lutispora saccharofermentans]|uniref:Fibronectin type III domain-containing protein n=1 Tax=Lutispora saccharofermentans TaxID=3024236 RepID=A0ABT1NCJ9_9FIRM|nr:fibronectin type III domain-containing protein [Lutispora saccharofermentans]MCQ1528866.1 fibronectin type III domain-containing protein [Lutispora saccharofermentans]